MLNDNVIKLECREQFEDHLIDFLRQSSQTILRIALEVEVSEFIKQFDGQRGKSGGAEVVRCGYQPERQVCTGIGPMTIKVPKVRSTTDEPVSFRSLLVPPYIRKTRSLSASVSWLYLKGFSTGDMQEALKLVLGKLADGVVAVDSEPDQDRVVGWSWRRFASGI